MITWFIGWWIKGQILSLVGTNIIPAFLSYMPSPLRGLARVIFRETFVIRVKGIVITIGLGTLLGYFIFGV